MRKSNHIVKRASSKISAILSNHPLVRSKGVRSIGRFIKNIIDDDISGIAAETAFFLLLSIFPFILIIAPTLNRFSIDLENEVIGYFLPKSIAELVSGVLSDVPIFENLKMISILISVWSASTGIWALMRGICRAYTGKNPPKPILKQLRALLFVIVFTAVVAFGLSAWFIGESLLRRSDGLISIAVLCLKYSITFAGILIFVLELYVYTPGYNIKKRHMLPGAAAASAGWLIASRGFEIYIHNFSNYSALYGSVGTFLGLALWLFLICFVILIGAELNQMIFKNRVGNR